MNLPNEIELKIAKEITELAERNINIGSELIWEPWRDGGDMKPGFTIEGIAQIIADNRI